ncbi:hypothetical protein GRX03_14445 [Halovenus sp. WSH3]|uniref:Uncharacterized protein n=1 Tax=Halovenus carboxidivorans TaxID=2692199 RepID=A0A6B0TD11_9EURY|nr:hypothetical protein [Halovenus carboxidivorans]MXR52800.1 hypothetical protein [Halovenus carboxidivorans]
MAESEEWDGAAPWLFLLGLAVFLGSAVLFVVDLIRGVDVLRSIGANGLGTALLIAWAAHDTLRNPESEVATPAGAAGTALLLYGLYLLGAGVVIAVTGLVHDRLRLGFWYVGLAVVAVAVGYFIFPKEAVLSPPDADSVSGDEPE